MNFNLVINSRFRPFTYDEMVKPLVQYKEVYDKVEQDYSNLAAQTEMWKNVANQTNSPEAYAMYKGYSDQLNAIVDDFSKGMTMQNRGALLGMKRDYAKNIVPIARADERRRALAEDQRKAELSNPTMLWERRAENMSLDDFIRDPNATYGRSYSGAMLTQQVSQAAANLAKEANNSEEGRARLKKILPFQYEYARKNGFSSDAVMKAILNEPDADKILTGIVDNAVNSSGVLNWGDDATKAAAYQYARQGLYNAIGQTQYQMVTDEAGMAAYKANLDYDNAKRIKALDNPNPIGNRISGSIPIDIHHLLSPDMAGVEGKEKINKALSFFKINPTTRKAKASTGVGIIESGFAVDARNKDGKNNFKMWSNDGKLLTKYQFMSQGRTAEDRRRLGIFYDRDITENAAVLGYNLKSLESRGKVPHINNFVNSYVNSRSDSSPYKMGVLAIKFNDNEKVLKNLLPSLTYEGDKTYIKEIKSYDRQGNIRDTGKAIGIDTFLDSSGKLTGTPNFYASPSGKSIIMQFNGKQYVVPKEKLGSLMNQSDRIDIPELQRAQSRKQNWINDYGEEVYYSSKEGQLNEQIINNSGASYLRTVYNALGWEAKQPSYNVNITSESQIP